MPETLSIAKLPSSPDARLPTRNHPQDAGMDVYCYGEARIEALSSRVLHTGITIEIPEGYVLQVWPKGKSEHLIGAGIIDAGYQGEILIKVFNPTQNLLSFSHGEAIAQLVLVPVETPIPVEVSFETIHKERSARGATGGINQWV